MGGRARTGPRPGSRSRRCEGRRPARVDGSWGRRRRSATPAARGKREGASSSLRRSLEAAAPGETRGRRDPGRSLPPASRPSSRFLVAAAMAARLRAFAPCPFACGDGGSPSCLSIIRSSLPSRRGRARPGGFRLSRDPGPDDPQIGPGDLLHAGQEFTQIALDVARGAAVAVHQVHHPAPDRDRKEGRGGAGLLADGLAGTAGSPPRGRSGRRRPSCRGSRSGTPRAGPGVFAAPRPGAVDPFARAAPAQDPGLPHDEEHDPAEEGPAQGEHRLDHLVASGRGLDARGGRGGVRPRATRVRPVGVGVAPALVDRRSSPGGAGSSGTRGPPGAHDVAQGVAHLGHRSWSRVHHQQEQRLAPEPVGKDLVLRGHLGIRATASGWISRRSTAGTPWARARASGGAPR